MEAELQDARRQLREAQRRHEADDRGPHPTATTRPPQALTSDREQITQAHAALQDELQQHAGALESTREALAAERAEAGGCATGSPSSRRTGRAAPPQPPQGPPVRRRHPRCPWDPRRQRRPAEPRAAEPRGSRRSGSRAAAQRREPDPTETQRLDVLGLHDELETESAAAPSRHAPRRSGHQTPDTPAWNPPVAERLRPVNPSLRHRTWWFGRLLALLVLCGVIAAVWIVLHSTVLH